MFKKVISLILVSLLLTAAFFALPTKALSERMKYLTDKKVLVGDENGDLMLDKAIDRASLSKILVYALGQEKKADALKNVPTAFSDVKTGSWANGYVNVVLTEGIVNGYPDGRFGPNDNVTFEQAIKMFTIAALGHDLEGAEAAKGKGWATPYIQKASELGFLNHMKTNDFKAIAQREEIFDILYEVLMYKENQKTEDFRGMVMEILQDNKARVLIMNSDSDNIKKEDIVELAFENSLKPDDFLGRVIDFKLGEDKILRSAVVAKEYETYIGSFTIGKDGLLYLENSKRGLIIEENKESFLNDSLVNIIHNDENYSLAKYKEDTKNKVDFGVVTVHNSKVVFIRSYEFKDIAPVSKVNNDAIYVLRDSSPNSEARQNVVKALEVNGKELKFIDPSRINVDDVLHIYKDGYVIVNRYRLNDAKFKVEDKNKQKVLTVDNRSYGLSNENMFRAIVNVNYQEYDTVYTDKDIKTLKSMEGIKSVLLIDLFGNVQLIRGDLQEKEEIMAITGTTSNKIRLKDANNREIEVVDNYAIDIFEGKNAIKMTDLIRGDLVYAFTKDSDVKGISVVIRNKAILDEVEDVELVNGKYNINLNPSRGRFALINTNKGQYELTNKSLVIVKDGYDYRFTTIAEISENADTTKNLKATVVSYKDFKDANTGSKIPASDRADLIHTIIFTNYAEKSIIEDKVIVKLINGYNPKIDREIKGKTIKQEETIMKVSPKANLMEFEPGDIIEASIDKAGDIIKAQKLIDKNSRTYEILTILEKDGVTKLEIKRTDTNETFTKYLANNVVVFGNLKEGAIMRMSVENDDIICLEIVK